MVCFEKFIYTVSGKSVTQTMCSRIGKSEDGMYPVPLFLNAYICERIAKFHEKILFDSGVINLQTPKT